MFKFSMLGLFLMLSLGVYAQRNVEGLVVDSKTMEPLVGAAVVFRITSYNVCYTKLLRALPGEMKSVAKELGQEVLRPLSMEDVVKGIPTIREKVGDRALLRSIHFQADNARVVEQVAALEGGKFDRNNFV